MNDFLATVPFDLYELALFRLVVKHRSFTKAAEEAGITQSAITRQMQGMENRLDIELLERTTRSVHVTKAGEFLCQESARLLGDVDNSLRRLKEEFANAPKEIRIGVSRSISMAHLPGFFHANVRSERQVRYHVTCQPGGAILSALESNELDLGVLCPPKLLSRTLAITHRISDTFVLIAPKTLEATFLSLPKSEASRTAWLSRQTWLLIEESGNTGRELRRWMRRLGLKIEPAMQLDSFDLIINLVALGLGISLVPRRSLALYGRKSSIARLPMKERFTRNLVVVMRRHRKKPEHLTRFIDNILF